MESRAPKLREVPPQRSLPDSDSVKPFLLPDIKQLRKHATKAGTTTVRQQDLNCAIS